MRLFLIAIAALLSACDNASPGPSAADRARAENAEAARELREKMGAIEAPRLPPPAITPDAGVQADARQDGSAP